MGGCCCCSSRRSQLNGTPLYYYCPQTLEEHESLSSHHGAASVLSTGLLIDINLETSTPDTYQAPPTPLPYDVDLGRPQTPVTRGSSVNKSGTVLQTTDIEDVGEIKSGIAFETSATCEGLKELVCESDINSVLTKEPDVELSKLSEPIVSATEEEDVCPTCFEEYDSENPKIITKCKHHFHLSCILEWMERSDTCPVCDQKMMLNHTSTG